MFEIFFGTNQNKQKQIKMDLIRKFNEEGARGMYLIHEAMHSYHNL